MFTPRWFSFGWLIIITIWCITFLLFSMYFIVTSLYVLTTHVTVCICHAELKGYLLNHLLLFVCCEFQCRLAKCYRLLIECSMLFVVVCFTCCVAIWKATIWSLLLSRSHPRATQVRSSRLEHCIWLQWVRSTHLCSPASGSVVSLVVLSFNTPFLVLRWSWMILDDLETYF